MRLEKIQKYLTEKGLTFRYCEQDELGSLDFEHRGVGYHIWEFSEDGQQGAESNVRSGGRMEDYLGDYEQDLIREMENWE